MNSKVNKCIRKLASYMRRTFKNKLCAIALVIMGVLAMKLSGDATFLVLIAMIGVPMFFMNKNCIY